MEMNNPGMLNQIGLHVKCKLVSSHELQTRLRIIYIDLLENQCYFDANLMILHSQGHRVVYSVKSLLCLQKKEMKERISEFNKKILSHVHRYR